MHTIPSERSDLHVSVIWQSILLGAICEKEIYVLHFQLQMFLGIRFILG